jgi:hypothetical protein
MLSVGMAHARAAEPATRSRKPATTLRVESPPSALPPWRGDGTLAGRLAGAGRRGDWALVVASTQGVGFESSLVFLAMVSAQGRRGMVNGPPCDGLSLREQRPHDQSGLMMLPLLVGRF